MSIPARCAYKKIKMSRRFVWCNRKKSPEQVTRGASDNALAVFQGISALRMRNIRAHRGVSLSRPPAAANSPSFIALRSPHSRMARASAHARRLAAAD